VKFTPEEIAAFDRYAQKMRALGARYGFDFGEDGAKIVAAGVLLVKATYGTLAERSTTRRRPVNPWRRN
jgi:hypothetical protein